MDWVSRISFRRNPETLGNGNFCDVSSREELLEMLGFCEPAFAATELRHSDEQQQLLQHSADGSCGHRLSGFPEVRSQETALAQEMR